MDSTRSFHPSVGDRLLGLAPLPPFMTLQAGCAWHSRRGVIAMRPRRRALFDCRNSSYMPFAMVRPSVCTGSRRFGDKRAE